MAELDHWFQETLGGLCSCLAQQTIMDGIEILAAPGVPRYL